jgi:hypothetical protein
MIYNVSRPFHEDHILLLLRCLKKQQQHMLDTISFPNHTTLNLKIEDQSSFITNTLLSYYFDLLVIILQRIQVLNPFIWQASGYCEAI